MNTEYNSLEAFVDSINERSSRESEKWSGSLKGMPFSRALRRSIDRYARAYYKKKGRKDGVYGYILAILAGFYQIISYAKYWEKTLGIDDPNKIKDSDGCKVSEKTDPSGRRKFSVVIIAKDEEDKIRNCLESIKWVDEIVVVDGLSTDRTVDICEEYGAKVVRHKFEGDFGQERNIGVENSSGDWILQLDADEVVTEGFRKKMMEILALKEDKFVSYKFKRKNFFMSRFMRYGGWYHHSHHMFKKGFAHYDGRVHHQLIVDGETGLLDEDIEHNPFQSFFQLLERQNRYTTIEARELVDTRGKVDEKEIWYNVRTRPRKLFWKFYVKKKGYREGMHGFLFSVFFAWVHFIKWAKYWEMVRDK